MVAGRGTENGPPAQSGPPVSGGTAPAGRGGGKALPKWGLLVVIAAAAAALDLWTKSLAEQRLVLGEVIEVLPFFSWQRTANSGVAFGLLHDQWWLILVANAVAIAVVLVYVFMERRWLLAAIGGGMIIGGSVGNVVQRVTGDGHVTDFMKFPVWPNFNLADVFIVVGIVVVFLGLMVEAARVYRAGRKTPASQ
jgi:signal peptidase II